MREFIQAVILAFSLGVVAWCSAQAIAKHDQNKIWWGP